MLTVELLNTLVASVSNWVFVLLYKGLYATISTWPFNLVPPTFVEPTYNNPPVKS